MESKKIYERPLCEIIFINVEEGFALSTSTSIPGDDGGELGDMD